MLSSKKILATGIHYFLHRAPLLHVKPEEFEVDRRLTLPRTDSTNSKFRGHSRKNNTTSKMKSLKK